MNSPNATAFDARLADERKSNEQVVEDIPLQEMAADKLGLPKTSIDLRRRSLRTSVDLQNLRRSITPKPSYPDGGIRAWSVVFGSFLMSFATFGWVTSFGVFQAVYQESILRDNSSSQISWIGSIQYALIFIPSLFTGRLLDLGYYNGPLAATSACYIASLFLVAECKAYWQFVLCQGVATGLFAGCIFGSTPAILTHWFLKRRFLAFGLLAIGSSIGGTVLPIAARQLFKVVSFQWTIRILAFILLVVVAAANALLRPRLPPSKMNKTLFNWSVFKNPAFVTCVLANNVSFLGLYVPLTYLDVSAQAAGISSNFSFYLVAIANGASLAGRVSSGILADKYGALNTLTPFTFIGGILTFAWPYAAASGVPALVLVSLIYGCATGAFVSLLPSAPSRMGGQDDAGSRIGMAVTFTSIGAAFGPPIAGAIRTSTGSFDLAAVYAGCMIMLGCMLMLVSRRLALGKWAGKF